jgi:hypothetical protein
MESTEELIWNKITNSAKGRFDYSTFQEDFPFDPDMIIFKIIIGFAANNEKEIIVLELFNEILIIGYTWDKKELLQFVEEKEKLFKLEIFVARLAINMLNEGTDPVAVYNSICKLL